GPVEDPGGDVPAGPLGDRGPVGALGGSVVDAGDGLAQTAASEEDGQGDERGDEGGTTAHASVSGVAWRGRRRRAAPRSPVRTRRARPTRSATAPPTRTVIAVVLHRSSVTLSSTCPISAPRAAVSTRVSGARSWSMVVVDSSSSVVAARQMSTVPGATGFPSPVVVVVRAQSRTPTPVTSARGASPSRVSTSEGRASP